MLKESKIHKHFGKKVPINISSTLSVNIDIYLHDPEELVTSEQYNNAVKTAIEELIISATNFIVPKEFKSKYDSIIQSLELDLDIN